MKLLSIIGYAHNNFLVALRSLTYFSNGEYTKGRVFTTPWFSKQFEMLAEAKLVKLESITAFFRLVELTQNITLTLS